MKPFLLPTDRMALLKTLSTKGAPHGDMLATLSGPLPPAETARAWEERHPTEGQPLILYVHIPFCVSRCAFCGFYAHRTDEAALEAYTGRLLREIAREADRGAFTTKPVDVVYFGGGTPTALSAEQLRRVIGAIYERFNVAPDVEFTVEGRIYGFDDERVRACLESGVTRFSFGIQSFQTELRRSLGRRNSREELLARLEAIKGMCGDKIALVADLIYGLPSQTQEQWLEENGVTWFVGDERQNVGEGKVYNWNGETGWIDFDWDPAGVGLWAPENRTIDYGPTTRTICEPENRNMYIMVGCRNTINAKHPDATGTYVKLHLGEDMASTNEEAATWAKYMIFYASRDVDRAGGEDKQRVEYLDMAKQARFEGLNYTSLARSSLDPDEQRLYYGKATSAYGRAQCYAQMAMDDPTQIPLDGNTQYFMG